MTKSNALRFGPVSDNAVHLCVDMQRMFAKATEWETPWFQRVLPNIVVITEARPSHSVFTRSYPPESLERVPEYGSVTTSGGT